MQIAAMGISGNSIYNLPFRQSDTPTVALRSQKPKSRNWRKFHTKNQISDFLSFL